MNRAYVALFLLFLKVSLWGSIDTFFQDEDPSFYHHVNVISGHLQFAFEDTTLKGPVPFSVRRTYSSTGVLERSRSNFDRILTASRECKWMLSGGWTFLPEAHLDMRTFKGCRGEGKRHFLDKSGVRICCYGTVKTKSGTSVTYGCAEHGEAPILRPSSTLNSYFNGVEPRKSLKNSYLQMLSQEEAILYLPDGGERHYKGSLGNEALPNWWLLQKEILPSKHVIEYSYGGSKNKKLQSIKVKNPKGDKVFASITLDEDNFKEDETLKAMTSDGVKLQYVLGKFKERTYLDQVFVSGKPDEKCFYEPGRKGTGARCHTLALNQSEKFKATFNMPPTKKKEDEWANTPYPSAHWVDRVCTISLPNPEGELTWFAKFSYPKNCTEVEDYEGVVTKYFHDGSRLEKIEHYNKDKKLYSIVKFKWDDGVLKEKILCDKNGNSLLSRVFNHDVHGNLTEEKVVDHQSGEKSLSRQFSYYPKTHLIETEREASGLTHRYTYHPSTDLVSSKVSSYDGKVCLRELTEYDEDHLPIRKVIDDGENGRYRTIEEYSRDKHTGLIQTTRKKVFDFSAQKEVVVSTHQYTYTDEKNINTEEITLGEGEISYTLAYEYDERGNVIQKTTPTGRVETFSYDGENRLKGSKSSGNLEKRFAYSGLGYPVECTEGAKTILSEYDQKGRLKKQTDYLKNVTEQKFDEFGRCTETSFSKVLDENGEPYTPKIKYAYDLVGNLASVSNPKGEKTITEYNLLGKAIRETKPDGSVTGHAYNPDGTLATTTLPNGTHISYVYDPFQRMVSKKILDGEKVLREESWVYSTFHLLSYTNPQGLTTQYEYNALGQKIAESTGDRRAVFTYDLMGNIERQTIGEKSIVNIYNLEGEVEIQWEEGVSGKKENHMKFVYNDRGQKIKVIRLTSQGIAEDTLSYDDEGRLVSHIDPLNHETQFLYRSIENQLGQQVEQKITIDPRGLSTIETSDANGRAIEIERQDENGQTVGKTELFYDKAGNRAKRVTYLLGRENSNETHTTLWEYDAVGRVIKEIEEGRKITLYSYTPMGQLLSKTLPSQTILQYRYDLLGRLVEMRSSDQRLHYTYLYGKGDDPIEGTDKLRKLTWKRSYNIFGELLSETSPQGFQLFWTYDNVGRCTQFTLPDHSSISYTYGDLHLEQIQRNSPENRAVFTHCYTQFDENGHVAEEELIHGLGSFFTTHDLLERPHRQSSSWHATTVTYGPSGLVTSYDAGHFPIKHFSYDGLNQLTQAGKRGYSFDSLGNPTTAEINSLNQIVRQGETHLTYDLNGNPTKQEHPHQSIEYTYDSLGRLTSIGETKYIYDPFNRLYAKEKATLEYYLYDKEVEIGTLSSLGEILTLKVVGLGILGDIGGTVAIEIEGEHFVPFHDFAGNVNLLVASDGSIVEWTDMDPFGQATAKPSINPWRFSSKRCEESLIFFGKRFYSPELKRFLTPDPIGQAESPNLYLFVQNSPLNRLDLFGLTSTMPANEIRLGVSISDIHVNQTYVHCNAYINGVLCDWVVYSNQLTKIHFTPEELAVGYIDLTNHFNELTPKEGVEVGLSTFMNGINVPFPEFEQNFFSHAKNMPEGLLSIGMHLPTRGVAKDVGLTFAEKAGIRTSDSKLLKQALLGLRESLNKVNPNMLMYHTAHSRGGATLFTAISGMTSEERAQFKESVISVNFAPAQPLPSEWFLWSLNIYSNQDGITGSFGRLGQLESKGRSPRYSYFAPPEYCGPNYSFNIEFIPCRSSFSQRTLMFDHGFLGQTYQDAEIDTVTLLRSEFRFYGSSKNR